MPRRRPASAPPAPVFWRNPRLSFLEGRCSREASACYRPHTHPTLSVGIVDGGAAQAVFAGHYFMLRPGDVVLIGPGVVHACNPLPGTRWSYRMFYFDRAWAERVAPGIIPQFTAHRVHGPLHQLAATRAVELIATAAADPQAGPDMEDRITRALRRLIRLARPLPEMRTKDGENAALVTAVQQFLARECYRKLPLRALARDLGQDHYGLIRRFRSQLGLTPHAYKIDQQVTQARALLAGGNSIADVAHALGFADQSHFQRMFKSRTAATPAQYRGKVSGTKRTTRPVRERTAER